MQRKNFYTTGWDIIPQKSKGNDNYVKSKRQKNDDRKDTVCEIQRK